MRTASLLTAPEHTASLLLRWGLRNIVLLVGFAFPVSMLLTQWLSPTHLLFGPPARFRFPLLELTVLPSAIGGFTVYWVVSLLHSSATLLLAQRLSSARLASVLALPAIPLTLWYGADLMGRPPGVYTTVPQMMAGSAVFLLFAWVAGGSPDRARESRLERILTLAATAVFGLLLLVYLTVARP